MAPSALVAAETKVGVMPSGTRLLTAVGARLIASLPAASWMAAASLPVEASV
ncbi:hypothetical protein D3C85_1920840 [compost metagenome]